MSSRRKGAGRHIHRGAPEGAGQAAKRFAERLKGIFKRHTPSQNAARRPDEAAGRAAEALNEAQKRIASYINAADNAEAKTARADKWPRADNAFNEVSRAINARARGTLHDIRFSMSTRISWNYARILWETLVIALALLAFVYIFMLTPRLDKVSDAVTAQVAAAAHEISGGLSALPAPPPSGRPPRNASDARPRRQIRQIDLRIAAVDTAFASVSDIDGRIYYDDAPFSLENAAWLSSYGGELFRVNAMVVNVDGHAYQIYVAVALTYWLKLFAIMTGGVALVDLARGLYFLTKGRAVNAQMLDPIVEISETARALNAQNMSRRINVEGTRSELRELALVINDMLDRLEAAYDGQKQFVSDASHELRTPIAVIQGYASMLARWGKDDAAVRDEAISAISNEAANMKELVEKLLFLARHDKQTLEMKSELVDMRELLLNTARETRMIDKKHAIECGEMQEVRVLGDPAALKQALRIFVDNARKYTPEGGKIELSCRRAGMGAMLSVADNGCGIPAGELKRIFDRFYRVDGSRGAVPGHGLGLSIARIIAVNHGGKIHVRSKAGAGSTFTLELPGIK